MPEDNRNQVASMSEKQQIHDPDLNSMKHPLENSWSFWFYTNSSKDWDQNQISITSFDTVEDFWCLYHHTKMPSELQDGQDYSVFKTGIRPAWEDGANRRGCRLVLLLDKKQPALMDELWQNTILMVIGENFEDLNHLIMGVVINIKPRNNKNKISIWLADKHCQEENIRIGEILKNKLNISIRLHFYIHNSRSVMYSV